MARINISPVNVSARVCRNQIDRWASGGSTVKAAANRSDRNMKMFLNKILKAFEKELMDYYSAGGNPEDKFQRFEEIRQALTEIGFTDGDKRYSIAPNIAPTGRKTCPDGRTCYCGVCQ